MTIIPKELVPAINHSMEMEIPATGTLEQLREKLSVHINELINHDFEKLVYYLYRIDVDENKMRRLLEQREGENAAALIADLIIERIVQKKEARKQFKTDSTDSKEERW